MAQNLSGARTRRSSTDPFDELDLSPDLALDRCWLAHRRRSVPERGRASREFGSSSADLSPSDAQAVGILLRHFARGGQLPPSPRWREVQETPKGRSQRGLFNVEVRFIVNWAY